MNAFDRETAKELTAGMAMAAVAYLVLQLALPVAAAFSTQRPAPLGWQMFSSGRLNLHFDVTYTDGRVERHTPERLVVHSRDDIPFARLLPSVLCARPGAVVVDVDQAGDRWRVRCDD